MLDHCQRTAVMEKTLNPVWDQTLIINITFYGDLGLLMKYCPPITLEVFDKDVLVSKVIKLFFCLVLLLAGGRNLLIISEILNGYSLTFHIDVIVHCLALLFFQCID